MGSKRGVIRKQFRIGASIQVFEAEPASEQFWLTRDIGMGGMFLLMPAPWPVGSERTLLIKDQDLQIECKVRVVRVTPDGVGILFLSKDELFRRSILAVILGRFASGDHFLDRRMNDRFQLNTPVILRVGASETPGILANANLNGVYIETEAAPGDIGTLVEVSIPAASPLSSREDEPADLSAVCQLKIVHRQPDGFGAAFVEPSKDFLVSLSELIARSEEANER